MSWLTCDFRLVPDSTEACLLWMTAAHWEHWAAPDSAAQEFILRRYGDSDLSLSTNGARLAWSSSASSFFVRDWVPESCTLRGMQPTPQRFEKARAQVTFTMTTFFRVYARSIMFRQALSSVFTHLKEQDFYVKEFLVINDWYDGRSLALNGSFSGPDVLETRKEMLSFFPGCDGASVDEALTRKDSQRCTFVFKNKSQQGQAKALNILLDLMDTEFWIHFEDDHMFYQDVFISRLLEPVYETQETCLASAATTTPAMALTTQVKRPSTSKAPTVAPELPTEPPTVTQWQEPTLWQGLVTEPPPLQPLQPWQDGYVEPTIWPTLPTELARFPEDAKKKDAAELMALERQSKAMLQHHKKAKSLPPSIFDDGAPTAGQAYPGQYESDPYVRQGLANPASDAYAGDREPYREQPAEYIPPGEYGAAQDDGYSKGRRNWQGSGPRLLSEADLAQKQQAQPKRKHNNDDNNNSNNNNEYQQQQQQTTNQKPKLSSATPSSSSRDHRPNLCQVVAGVRLTGTLSNNGLTGVGAKYEVEKYHVADVLFNNSYVKDLLAHGGFDNDVGHSWGAFHDVGAVRWPLFTLRPSLLNLTYIKSLEAPLFYEGRPGRFSEDPNITRWRDFGYNYKFHWDFELEFAVRWARAGATFATLSPGACMRDISNGISSFEKSYDWESVDVRTVATV